MFCKPGPITEENKLFKRLELFLSFSIYLTFITYIFKDACLLSRDLHSEYKIVGLKNSPYIPSQKADLDDGQLRSFLEGLPLLTIVAFIFIVLRKLLLLCINKPIVSLIYYIIFGLLYSLYIHGFEVILLVLYVSINFVFVKIFAGKKWFPLSFWFLNLVCFILVTYFEGFEFTEKLNDGLMPNGFKVVLRWFRVLRFFLLKILSFGMDYHWKISGLLLEANSEHGERCKECSGTYTCLAFKVKQNSEIYSIWSCLAYSFYAPLYLAGPTITYNAWIYQVQSPTKLQSQKLLIFYLIRLIFLLFFLLLFIHILFFPTIASNSDNRGILESMSPYELLIMSFFVLKWIWLKFTVIWRFFRIWALFDGIESPENMNRCMSNNYCFEGFWRSWHRSFNLWLIRYLFIPLGGSSCKVLNIWAVFGFVAIWHDLTLKLLVWGWGMCIFIMPEILMKKYFSRQSNEEFRKTLLYSWLCAIGGGIYICLMIIANLIGYSFGLSGLDIFISKIFSPQGLYLVFVSISLFTIATHFMFFYRHEERKRGVKDKGF